MNQINIPSVSADSTEEIPSGLKRWWRTWQFWAIVITLLSGGIGFTATSILLKLPKSPQCSRIFWPVASASMRLYCAQLEAEQGTVDSLLNAITLVEALPDDHPLRTQVNQNVEQWAVEILDLAEESFQSGQLEQAIATAQKIPSNVHAYGVVEERINQWRSIWEEGETIFEAVEEQLRDANWNFAFREAVKLLSLDNHYWATTKYDETVNQIQIAREESRQLDDAFAILRRGGIDNWLTAITAAEKIRPESYAYREAQNLIQDAKDKIIAHVQTLIDRRNWQAILSVTDKIPQSLVLAEDVNDWKTLASAGMDAQFGTVESLETAIVTAQQIDPDRPLYNQAQDLVNRWQVEIEDVAHLAQAKDYAQQGGIDNLNAAIAEAQQVAQGNPRYSDAKENIASWQRKIQIIEDQPIIDEARQIARAGTVPALQKAIAQASLIGSNRALYSEARDNIRQWRNTIEREEDEPILDQALALGNVQDYSSAIDTAQQIRRGRVLYSEAQGKIRQWQREIDARRNLQQAYAIAEVKTASALLNAIDRVRQIPSATDAGSQARPALNRWSYQILSIAKEQADQSLFREAIALANKIPPESAAYRPAKAQVQIWQQMIAPPPRSSTPPRSPNTPLVETNYPETNRSPQESNQRSSGEPLSPIESN